MMVYHFVLNRLAGYTGDWRTGMSFMRADAADALIEALKQAANNQGLTLVSEDPEPGFAAKFPRDGKVWPCPETTKGAYAVWIWSAR